MGEKKVAVTIESALVEYNTENLTMAAIKIFRDAEALECVDVESRKVIGKHRAQIKTFRIQVEDKRKEINRESQKENNEKAVMLVDILNLSFAVFDKKIKAYDAVAEEKRIAKAKDEKERLAKIELLFEDLDHHVTRGQVYNLKAETIQKCLDSLNDFEISAVDFSEQTEQAEILKKSGIETVERFLSDQIKREADQAEAEKVKAEQKAEAEKLAKEREKFKEAQVAEREKQAEAQAERDKIQKKKDDAAKKLAGQEAEKTRKANEELEADRKALEKEKAELAADKQADIDQKKAKEDAEKARVKKEKDDIEFEKSEKVRLGKEKADLKEKRQADKERAALVGPDKLLITTVASDLNQWITAHKTPVLNTAEANTLLREKIGAIKAAIHELEMGGEQLV